MCTTADAGRWMTRLRRAALLVSLSASSGCATLRATFGSYDTGPDGIARLQQRQREALAAGDFAAALTWHDDDALLRALDLGIASYYGAQYAQSGAILDTAALLADDRITASLSKNAAAMLTNDMARPYQARRTERLLIPYYGMLAFARLGAWEDAAVEARRLSLLLAQDAEDRAHEELPLHAALHHLAGVVFERAGNFGEAGVAYRNAHALAQGLPDSVSRPAPLAEGDLVVLVERGFVAHRVNETVRIYIGDADWDSLRDGRARRRTAERIAIESRREERHDAAPMSAMQAVLSMPSLSARRRHDDDDDDDARYLPIAFAALRRSPRPYGGGVRLLTEEGQPTPIRFAAMVDDATAVDERRDRVAVATRAIARAAAKYAVTTTIREKKGEVAGTIAELGASLLERADVRSWHLLPQEVTIMRQRLPSGPQRVQLQVGSGSRARTIDLGIVTITPGTVTLLPTRLWRE